MTGQIEAIRNEQVDDIPLLLEVIRQMGVIEIFNETIEQHGNWKGLGAGHIIAVWLAYILSTGDHRKSRLQEWAAERGHSLQHSLGAGEIRELDFTDDRLGIILQELSDDGVWQRSEREINRRIISVYELEGEVARIDTTTASSYGEVTEEGLLQFGYSKDRRPELGQVKIASVTLDPLGLPLVTIPVSGEEADDGMYIPAIEEARKSIGGKQVMYVGDSKMGSFETRSYIAGQGESYLMPLSKKQVNEETMLGYLEEFEVRAEEEGEWEKVVIVDEKGEERLIAEGFTVEVVHREEGEEGRREWKERRFMVLSPEYAGKQRTQLEKKIEKAEAALKRLVRRRQGYHYPKSAEELEKRVSAVLTNGGCEAYLKVKITQESRRKKIRRYKNRPAREEKRTTFRLQITRREAVLAKKQKVMGWRVYATNAPKEKLSFFKAVEVYRDAYLHEHGYSRLKGKPLSLTPMYLQKDEQITGLIRLLSLALRVLTLIEFVVRRRLAEEGGYLKGVYAGNRNRRTKTPRTETLLEVFKGLILTIIHTGEKKWVHLTPLSATQKRILQLLGISEEIYTSLTPESSKLILKSAN